MPDDPLKHEAAPATDFDAQYRRIFEATECETQYALARLLEITPGTVSYIKRRRAIPESWLRRLLRKAGVNPEWILYGTGRVLVCPKGPPGWEGLAVSRALERNRFRGFSTEELLAELVRRVLKQLH